MDSSFAKHIISTFNCDTFSKFLFELWGYTSTNEVNTCIETKYIKKLGSLPFEMKKTIYTTKDKVLIDSQIFNLVIPFFVPYEKLNSIDKITENHIKTILRKYRRIADDRYLSWFWPCDGMYQIPIISFVTNYLDVEINQYYEDIMPIFEKMVDDINLEANVAVGSIDSLFEFQKQATIDTLFNFIEQYRTGLVFSLFTTIFHKAVCFLMKMKLLKKLELQQKYETKFFQVKYLITLAD